MKKSKKIIIILIISAIIINIPIVSDVIAVTRVGLIYNVIDIEKSETDTSWLFVLDDSKAVVTVIDHTFFNVRIKIDDNGKVNIYSQNILGEITIEVEDTSQNDSKEV